MYGVSTSLLFTVTQVYAQSSLPTAVSVPLAESIITPGAVVVFVEDEDIYRYSLAVEEEQSPVYGVVHERPPLYLETAVATVPVITDGITLVQVEDSNGLIARGDLLRLGSSPGNAARSTDTTDEVFAVALEAAAAGGETFVLADISRTRAEALRDARVLEAEQNVTEENDGLSAGAIAAATARIAVALGIVISSLAFILYTYRSIWVTGVTAVGRNPRARSSVLLMNVASSILILFLAALIVVVALGVLVVSV